MNDPALDRSLPAFSLRRPVTVTMAFVALMVVGLIAMKRIPLEFLPDISGPVLWVQIPHLNSTPQEIEQRIAVPAEGEMRTVKNVKKVESFINANYENLRIEFDWNTDMDYAYLEVTERLDRLLPSFPDDVERYLVWRFTASDLEIMWMDVGWEGATQDDLWRMIDTKLRPRLERIDGVAQIEVWGAKATRINVDLDQARLRKHGLGAVELIRAIEDSHVNLVSGNLNAEGTRYVVRSVHRYEDIEALRDLILNREGLRLKDVADVYYGPPPREMITRVDGRDTLAIGVKKESRANTIAVCRAVREVTEQMVEEGEYPGLRFTIGFDQSEYILESFENLASSGRWGALLAVVILFLFLRDLRSTLMIALAIPISIVMAVAVLFFLGKTLNVLSMMGLMLAVGMLVDNSIVVVESIVSAREAGAPAREAARDGAAKVALAITASTLTTVIVFLPLVFLDRGEIRVYMEDAGTAISLCLVASLLVALTIVPLAAGRTLAGAKLHTHPVTAVVGRAYGRALAWSLRNRLAVIVLLAGALAATYLGPIKSTGAQASAESNARSIKIALEVDGDYNLDRVEDYFFAFEKILNEHRGELDIEHLYVQSRSNQGAIHLFLEKEHAPTEELKDRVRALIPTYRDAKFRIVADDWSGRPESSVMSVRLTGRDPDLLRDYADLLASRLGGVEGIRDVHIETGRGKEEVRIEVDRILAASYGVPPGGVAQAIAFAFRGRDLPEINEGEKEVQVYVQLEESDRRSLEDLKQLEIETPRGGRIPLGAVARFETAAGYHTINRAHGRRYVEVNLESDRTAMTEVRKRVAALLDEFRMPVGYQASYGEAFVALEENQSAVKNAMIMSVMLIYLLLGSLFESYLLPITVLVSVPLAFMGSYWLMYLLGTPMDYAAYIGLIILIGIVVNNAIVIVDRIGGRRDEGLELNAAVVAAAEDRFRPVVMTALTTIIGLIPLAFVGGASLGGSLQFYPMGRVVIGGMVTATFLTLFVVPVLYTLTVDLGKVLGSLTPSGRAEPPGEAEATPR